MKNDFLVLRLASLKECNHHVLFLEVPFSSSGRDAPILEGRLDVEKWSDGD